MTTPVTSVPETEDTPPAAGLLPAGPARSAFDAPLVSVTAKELATGTAVGFTPDELAAEIAASHDLGTPDGWTEAMRTLAGRREVLRRLARDLTLEDSHPKLFHAALKYVTENGVGQPVERHEHLHRGTIVHAHVAPPIRWSDEPPQAPADR